MTDAERALLEAIVSFAPDNSTYAMQSMSGTRLPEKIQELRSAVILERMTEAEKDRTFVLYRAMRLAELAWQRHEVPREAFREWGKEFDRRIAEELKGA